MSDVNILVCGDVEGNFEKLFSKVDEILKKKGTFEYLFCVGDFFGDSHGRSSMSYQLEDLIAGKINVPITTYILGANEVEHEKCYNYLDSIPNINYLGKKGYFTGISGLKIAYLSGWEEPESSENSHSECQNECVYFSKEDVIEMINSLESEAVDILITSQWPKGITKYAVPLGGRAAYIARNSSSLISILAEALKPRYHFSAIFNVKYERQPYRNHAVAPDIIHLTRFYALPTVGNTQRQKWLYAFSIKPACCLSSKQLEENSGDCRATVCPYDSAFLNKSFEKFFFDTASPGPSKKRSPEDFYSEVMEARKKLFKDSSSCWFCLTNPNFEKQLIIGIGSHCYVTLPKGVLVPEHVLIVPVKHAISSAELSIDVYQELLNFKKSLARYFDARNKDIVFYETNYYSTHLQVQVVPVPKQFDVKIREALFSKAKEYGLEFKDLSTVPHFTNPLSQQVVPPKKPYFYFELMVNKEIQAKYLHIINKNFPLQFGRSVLAGPEILNVTDRIDWKNCVLPKRKEQIEAEVIRKFFKPYDWTQFKL